MLKFGKHRVILAVLIVLFLSGSKSFGQNTMPEVLKSGSLEDQMTYVNDRTRIYENYRAIREDIFQKMKSNALDSLGSAKNDITDLLTKQSALEANISDLNQQITRINDDLNQAINNRDSLQFFGMNMTKSAYNKLLWAIIIGLLALSVFSLLLFKRSNVITRTSNADLEDIKREFEDFRKVAHENKEKLIVSHFNEIKKLREMGR